MKSAVQEAKKNSSVGATIPKILTGNRILLEGFADSDILQLAKIISSQGAVYGKEFDVKATCIIAKVVGGPKFRLCVQNRIPCVTSQWIIDCVKQKNWLPFSDYVVPPFLGIILCCSGFDTVDRNEIKIAVEQLGGVFMKDLMRGTTTHLVCMSPVGPKYESAISWGDVKIVNAHWVVDCVENNQWMPEENYFFEKLTVEISREEPSAKLSENESQAESKVKGDDPCPAVAPSEMHKKLAKVSNLHATGKATNALILAEKMLIESQFLNLPQMTESGEFLLNNCIVGSLEDDSTRNGEMRGTLLQNYLFFISGYSNEVKRYMQRLILLSGGQVSLVLSQDVDFAAIYFQGLQIEDEFLNNDDDECIALSANTRTINNSVHQIQANQKQYIFHQKALRLSQLCGLQRFNLVWCLDRIFGRSLWQHLLPSSILNELPVLCP